MSTHRPSSTPQPIEGLVVRSFQPNDQKAVAHLYTHGLLAGQIAPNDTGADIDNIQQAYLDEERHHFWVAMIDDQIVGMIGVGSDEPHTAEIRRLRVDPDHHNSEIPAILLKTAVDHCKHHGYLKVRLDTRFERTAAMDLFNKTGFQHTRTKSVQGKDLLEFYLDIYRQPKKGEENQDAEGHG